MVEVPERVQQVLDDYIEAGSWGIANLATDVRQPALAWFPAEFERLLPQRWGRALYRDDWANVSCPAEPGNGVRS